MPLLLVFLAVVSSTTQPFDKGIAVWYDLPGSTTASGEKFDATALKAAHRTLPFGSLVLVRVASGKQVVVEINDRGPFCGGYAKGKTYENCTRIIDLTPAAAKQLFPIGYANGVAYGQGRVSLYLLTPKLNTPLSPPCYKTHCPN